MNQQVNAGVGGGRRLGSNLAVNVNIQTPENGSDQVIQWDPFKVTDFSRCHVRHSGGSWVREKP